MSQLLSARLREMAPRYDWEDQPLLIQAAEALERHLLAALETTRPEALRKPVAWVATKEDGANLHFAVEDGWTVEPVIFAESPRQPEVLTFLGSTTKAQRIPEDQLEKTYWDAYDAARDGIVGDPHLLGLRAVVEAVCAPSPLRQKSDG